MSWIWDGFFQFREHGEHEFTSPMKRSIDAERVDTAKTRRILTKWIQYSAEA